VVANGLTARVYPHFGREYSPERQKREKPTTITILCLTTVMQGNYKHAVNVNVNLRGFVRVLSCFSTSYSLAAAILEDVNEISLAQVCREF